MIQSERYTATTETKTYSEYVKLMWSAKMRTVESAKDFYDRVVSYKTAATTALKKDLPPTANQANAVAYLEYLVIEAFIKELPDGWRTSFAAVAPTSLEQALSTAQVQERYRVPTGSNTKKNMPAATRESDISRTHRLCARSSVIKSNCCCKYSVTSYTEWPT